jgi:hypothetical protein
MTDARYPRATTPLARTAAALALVASLGSVASCARSAPAPIPLVAAVADQFQLRASMRELWGKQVFWTRAYLMSVVASLPDTGVTTERLRQNEGDLADSVRPFYGQGASDQLAALLHDHVAIASELVVAAKLGDRPKVSEASARWLDNADRVAALLCDASPTLVRAEVLETMRGIVEQTLAEARAMLAGDWQSAIQAYDQLSKDSLELADLLSAAMAAQFPDAIPGSPLPAEDQERKLAMRQLWAEQIGYQRDLLVSDYGALPDLRVVTVRLLQNQDEIGAAIRPFYGQDVAAALTALLHDHITYTAQVDAAVRRRDTSALVSAKTHWQANGHAIARLLSQANHSLTPRELDAMVSVLLDQLLEQAQARLAGDYGRDVTDFDAAEAEARALADLVSDAA